eukprot:5615558-Pyramimonas_sp.AAC.1
MYAALLREPRPENDPPSIREALANVKHESARLDCESHMLRRNHPQSAKPLQIYNTKVRGAKARTTS